MISIIIVGSRSIRHRTGCCGSRSQEEVVQGFIPTLYRTFGQRHISCKYLDIDDPGIEGYPQVIEAVRRKEMGLPLAIRDGAVILHGQSTLFQLPDYIRQAQKAEAPNASIALDISV